MKKTLFEIFYICIYFCLFRWLNCYQCWRSIDRIVVNVCVMWSNVDVFLIDNHTTSTYLYSCRASCYEFYVHKCSITLYVFESIRVFAGVLIAESVIFMYRFVDCCLQYCRYSRFTMILLVFLRLINSDSSFDLFHLLYIQLFLKLCLFRENI